MYRILFVCFFLSGSGFVHGQPTRIFLGETIIYDEVSEGVEWRQYRPDSLFSSRQCINIIFCENTYGHIFDLVSSEEEKKTTNSFAKNNDAIIAVNGSFFDVKNGGSVVFLQNNKKVSAKTTKVHEFIDEGAIALDRKGLLSIIEKPAQGWKRNKEFEDILSSGPMLILDGNIQPITQDKFNLSRHPRTAIGTKQDGTIVLVTVDGRSPYAQGMTIEELTVLMANLGCVDAINLDGGGSTTLWVNGRTPNGTVNYPSDNKEFDHAGVRKVANAIILKRKEK